MKKYLIIFLILIMLFITGCDTPENKNIQINYTEEDLKEISLYVSEIDRTFDVSSDNNLKEILLNLQLQKADNTDDFMQYEDRSDFVLIFSGYELTIYKSGRICYIDEISENDYLVTTNNAFEYLYGIFDFTRLNFNDYNNALKIQVFNSKGDSVEITDIEDFLSKLTKVEYIKVNNENICNTESLKYKIKVDDVEIQIYENKIIINGNFFMTN